jgi:hypothetical protein
LESRNAASPRQIEDNVELEAIVAEEASLSVQFDRAWARAMMRQAAEVQEANAAATGDAATRRVELLRLRFQEGLPIRDIASRWNEDAATVHREYAKARNEFKEALVYVVSFHHPGTSDDVQRECKLLLQILG